MNGHIVAVDIGTTHCRSLVYDFDGKVLARSEQSYQTDYTSQDAAEQDVRSVSAAVDHTVADSIAQSGLSRDSILGVVLCTVFHSLIGVDERDEPVTPLITWADTRSVTHSERLQKELDSRAVRQRTGCSIHPMYFPSRIAWLRAEMPDVFSRIRRLISIKEYVIRQWTGEYVVDLSVASGTGLLNLEAMEWDTELMTHLGLPEEMLSPLVEPVTALPQIKADVRTRLGLPDHAVLVVGAADGALAHLGTVGVSRTGVSLTVGTGAAIRRLTDKPAHTSKGETWCYYLAEKKWLHGTLVQDAGASFSWLVKEFFEEEVSRARTQGLDPYHHINEILSSTPPGANGLLFLPFLGGERSPNLNPRLRGAVFGIGFGTRRTDLVRALVEGIAYRLHTAFSCLVNDEEGVRIVVTGGFVSSPEWVQTTCDFFGREMYTSWQGDASAWGAALIGMLSLGHLSSIEEVDKYVHVAGVNKPRPENLSFYRAMCRNYASVYRSLVETQGKCGAQPNGGYRVARPGILD
ncbi:MAG: gluconokinase [Firmicutes bacterium]|jgi:gluconokinase|nr:gluconokinase [Bacillota bacterium]